MICFPKFLQGYSFISFHRNQIVVPFFVITDKKVFSVGFRVWDLNLGQLRHVIYCFVLGDFMPYILFLQEAVNFLLIHVFKSSLLIELRFPVFVVICVKAHLDLFCCGFFRCKIIRQLFPAEISGFRCFDIFNERAAGFSA